MKKRSGLLWLTIIGFGTVFIMMLFPTKSSTPSGTDQTVTTTAAYTETTVADADRLPNMPEKYYSNVLLDGRKQGGCETLNGTIKPIIIFVDDAEYQWSEEEIENYKTSCNELLDMIRQDAAEYDVTLTIEAEYLTSTTEGEFVRGEKTEWTDTALKRADLPYGDAINDALETLYNVDEVPLILCTNQSGRATASMNGSTEFIHMFNDATALRHEIYHLFGAEDFYYPAEVKNIAKTTFTNSVMIENDSVIDDLTAYLVGYTDTLSEKAKEFLEKTNHITKSDMEAAGESETYTGYVTDRKTEYGTYTGYLKDGYFEGEGTLYYNDGGVYVGEWKYNLMDGTGTHTFSDGSSYSGEWKNGERNGYGTYTFTDGSKYEGNFAENARDGYGTYYFSNGDTFAGQWKDNKREGYGTYTFADGSTISGIWADDELTE